jgi:hypothetical protein
VNSIATLLAYHDPEFLILERSDKIEVLSTCLLYLFRLCGSSELTESLKDAMRWTGAEAVKFRQSMARSGQIQKNLKFYIYERAVNTRRPDPEVYSVSEDDTRFVERMMKLTNQNSRYLRSGLRSYAKRGHPPRALTEFESGITALYPQMRVTAGKYVSKSFRWLSQSGQMDKDDLIVDLINSAIYAVYRAYPHIEDLQHMKNITTTAIHNRGVNILKEQSTQSRQRVFKNNDGTFRGDLLSFDHAGFESSINTERGTGGSVSVCNHLMVGLDGTSVAYERPTDVDRKRDLKKTIEQIGSALPGKKPVTFMRLLMGEHHVKFSRWLGQPNDEASDTMDRVEYADKVREYLRIEPEHARKFVLKLREHLSDFRN